MFFESKNIAVEIIDVLSFETSRYDLVKNPKRPYHAISFRKKADTVLCYDNKEIYLNGKSIALVPSGLKYDRKARDEEMIVVHFYADLSDRDIKIFESENMAVFEKLFDELLRIWKNKDSGYRFKASELFFQLLYMISVEESDSIDSTIASRAAKIIKRNAENQQFSVGELAPALNISGAYLRRLFKIQYGITPKEYLTQYRIETAKSLLKTGYFSVKEVSQRCGFENEKYFSTTFKYYCGASPSKYNK